MIVSGPTVQKKCCTAGKQRDNFLELCVTVGNQLEHNSSHLIVEGVVSTKEPEKQKNSYLTLSP